MGIRPRWRSKHEVLKLFVVLATVEDVLTLFFGSRLLSSVDLLNFNFKLFVLMLLAKYFLVNKFLLFAW